MSYRLGVLRGLHIIRLSNGERLFESGEARVVLPDFQLSAPASHNVVMSTDATVLRQWAATTKPALCPHGSHRPWSTALPSAHILPVSLLTEPSPFASLGAALARTGSFSVSSSALLSTTSPHRDSVEFFTNLLVSVHVRVCVVLFSFACASLSCASAALSLVISRSVCFFWLLSNWIRWDVNDPTHITLFCGIDTQ